MKKLFALFFPVLLFAQNPDFTKEEIKITDLVSGSLYSPKKANGNLVIMIAGSGPTNRDGNQPGMRTNAYKMLAEAIAKDGHSVFSYDKRIIAQIIAGDLDESKGRFDDMIDDAKAVVAYFRPKYKNIIVCGHSEGSLVGMIAANGTADGFISLAGAGRPADQLITEQIAKQAPFLENDAKGKFATLREGKTFKLENEMLAAIFRESLQPYLISWIKYDPKAEIQKLKIPTLIINGTKDIQVGVPDAEALKAAKPDAQIAIIENMNHVLKEIDKDQDNIPSYNNPELPVSPKLVSAVNQFLNKI